VLASAKRKIIMSNGSEFPLSIFLSYPTATLLISFVAGVVSVVLLRMKRRTLSQTAKTILWMICAIAAIIVILLVLLMFAFNSSHPIAPPVPLE
jgi:peptidoglycan/LPS O-acetylase OafA/YrhL